MERPPERGPADRPRLQGPGRRRTSTSSAPTPEIRACVTSRMRSPSPSRCGCTRRAERAIDQHGNHPGRRRAERRWRERQQPIPSRYPDGGGHGAAAHAGRVEQRPAGEDGGSAVEAHSVPAGRRLSRRRRPTPVRRLSPRLPVARLVLLRSRPTSITALVKTRSGSLGANRAHGKRLSRADKRSAIELAYRARLDLSQAHRRSGRVHSAVCRAGRSGAQLETTFKLPADAATRVERGGGADLRPRRASRRKPS